VGGLIGHCASPNRGERSTPLLIWQVTLRTSEMGFHEELYTPMTYM